MSFERAVNFGLVKADDNIASDVYYRNSPLTAFLNRLPTVLGFGLDVEILVLNADLIEVLLGGVTKSAPGSAIYRNFGIVICHESSIAQKSNLIIVKRTLAWF